VSDGQDGFSGSFYQGFEQLLLLTSWLENILALSPLKLNSELFGDSETGNRMAGKLGWNTHKSFSHHGVAGGYPCLISDFWMILGERREGSTFCLISMAVSDCEFWPAEWRMKGSFFFAWVDRRTTFWSKMIGNLEEDSCFFPQRKSKELLEGCPCFGSESLIVALSAAIWIPCLLLARLIWRRLVRVCIEFLMRKLPLAMIEQTALGGKSECVFLFGGKRVLFLLKLSSKLLGMPLLRVVVLVWAKTLSIGDVPCWQGCFVVKRLGKLGLSAFLVALANRECFVLLLLFYYDGGGCAFPKSLRLVQARQKTFRVNSLFVNYLVFWCEWFDE